MALHTHDISASWNRTGLTDGRLQYKVENAAGATLIDWTSAGLEEPVDKQYRASGIAWESSTLTTVFWRDELDRTAEEDFPPGQGTPVVTTGLGTILDGPIRGVVSTILGVLGATVTLTAPGGGVYDPLTGATSGGQSSWIVKCSPPDGFDVKEAATTVVKIGDFKILVSAKDLDDQGAPAPKVGWTATIVGRVSRVKMVDPIYAGDYPSAYTLYCGS